MNYRQPILVGFVPVGEINACHCQDIIVFLSDENIFLFHFYQTQI
jgi:hypothetical protein